MLYDMAILKLLLFLKLLYYQGISVANPKVDMLKTVDVFEEGILSGGINETICAGLLKNRTNSKVIVNAIPDEFIPHMSINSALEKYNLSADGMYNVIKEEKDER